MRSSLEASGPLMSKAGMVSCLLHFAIIGLWLSNATTQRINADSAHSVSSASFRVAVVQPMVEDAPNEKSFEPVLMHKESVVRKAPSLNATKQFVSSAPIENKLEDINVESQKSDASFVVDKKTESLPNDYTDDELSDILKLLETPSAGMLSPSSEHQLEEVGKLDSSDRGNLLEEYTAILRSWIANHQDYPRKARIKGLQGSVIISLLIDETGNRQATIIKGSGYTSLDRAA